MNSNGQKQNLVLLHSAEVAPQYACENCGHFYISTDGTHGQCRVASPGFDDAGWATWPKVHRDDAGCSLHTGRMKEAVDELF